MSKAIDTLVFDFYDVVHEDPQVTFLANQGLERTGGFAVASDLLDVGKIDYDEYLRRYAKHSGLSVKEVRRQYNQAVLNTDMRELLRWLATSDYRTGLLSNTTSAETRPILDRHDLTDLFDAIVISADVGMKKPDPAIFRFILDQLGTAPDSSVFIDDNPRNVDAARSVGMTGICFTDYSNLLEELGALGIVPPAVAATGGRFVLAS